LLVVGGALSLWLFEESRMKLENSLEVVKGGIGE
jgi:hypothetical protein